MGINHLLEVSDLSTSKIKAILKLALKIKNKPEDFYKSLAGKSIGLYFQKPSMRTKVSFELAIQQLGAFPIVLNASEIQIGVRESVKDVARGLSRYLDAIIMRVDMHATLEEFRDFGDISVINGLSDMSHPCQALADILTIQEKKGEKARIVYIGDGNNVCTSLIRAATALSYKIIVSCPKGYEPRVSSSEARFEIIEDPFDAVKDADVVYTDVWTSMGQEKEEYVRRRLFQDYQVNSKLVKNAKSDYIFMHCLPAHRGEEVTDAVLESAHSVVFDQAENRLHAQKAVLLSMLGV